MLLWPKNLIRLEPAESTPITTHQQACAETTTPPTQLPAPVVPGESGGRRDEGGAIVTPRIQLSIFATPTLAISGYMIYYFLRGWVFVSCFAFCSFYASRLMSSSALHLHFICMFFKTCIRSGSAGCLRCPFGVQTLSHAPATPPKYYFISGIKMFSEWVATCRAVLL